MTLKWKRVNKAETKKNGNRAIWLVYRTDTNARGFCLVKQTLGWKTFMLEEIEASLWRHTATRLANRIMPSPYYGFLWRENEESMFDLFIPWLIKQITNTYRNHFLRSYENRSNKLSNVGIFIILRSGEGLTSTNKDKSANFSGGKKVQLRILECVWSEWTTSNQISTRTRSRPRI